MINDIYQKSFVFHAVSYALLYQINVILADFGDIWGILGRFSLAARIMNIAESARWPQLLVPRGGGVWGGGVSSGEFFKRSNNSFLIFM